MSVSDVEAVFGENREFLFVIAPFTAAFLFHKTGTIEYLLLAIVGSFLPTTLIIDKHIRTEGDSPVFEQTENINFVVGITLILSWVICFSLSGFSLFFRLNHEDWFMVLLSLAYIFLIVLYFQIFLDWIFDVLVS